MKKKLSIALGLILTCSLPAISEACTTVLVGKDASVNGSTLIARNEDMGSAWAKHFYVRKANSNEK
ncbi:C69 family dipeptidase, partial [Enterococcus faecalis]|nr:C69 family dipeptidase [Enterococcus faecalis]